MKLGILLPIFGFPHKKYKNIKKIFKKKSKKIIKARKEYCNAEEKSKLV
jgi:type III secretory pathway lipoprotein EscJ